jgi:hypothetical protein
MISVLSSWRHGIARTASHQDESPAEYGREAVTASQRFLDELHSCSARLCFPCRPSFSTETIPFATIFSERLTVTCWLCLNSRRSSLQDGWQRPAIRPGTDAYSARLQIL